MHVASVCRYVVTEIDDYAMFPAVRRVAEVSRHEQQTIPRYRPPKDDYATKLVARERARALAELAGDVEGSWVYYIRMGDEIKIGVSVDPLKRAQSLSLNASHILAVEPGTQMLERKRHDQFRDLHLHGEWFRAEGALLDHIESLSSAAA
jgi:hypothetical protein